MSYFAVSVGAVHNDSTESLIVVVVVVVVDPTPPTCCQQSPAPESCGSLIVIAGISRSTTKKSNRRVEIVQKFWLPIVSVGDLALKRQLPFRS